MRRRIDMGPVLADHRVEGRPEAGRFDRVGLWVFGSDAALIVAWPKPDQTGVVGLKLWVRSTSCLLAITL